MTGPEPSTMHFCVIGAQKAGTTTLFELLRHHPQLALPADKEAPYFNDPNAVARGTAPFFAAHFPRGTDGRRIGTVTPHYMCEPGCAAALAAAFPALRLVAILRDPVERARSHHRMATRREQEQRPFAEVVEELLEPETAAAARTLRTLAGTYVAWSEYGRVLADYRDHFPADQLLVVSTADLESDPARLLAAVERHIGVEPWLPADLGVRAHQGGSRRRFPRVQRLLARGPAGAVYRRLPPSARQRLFMRFDHWNVRPDPPGSDLPLPRDLDARLRAHFADDEQALAHRYGIVLPWAGRTGS